MYAPSERVGRQIQETFDGLVRQSTLLVQRISRTRSARERRELSRRINANIARARILRHAPEVRRRMLRP